MLSRKVVACDSRTTKAGRIHPLGFHWSIKRTCGWYLFRRENWFSLSPINMYIITNKTQSSDLRKTDTVIASTKEEPNGRADTLGNSTILAFTCTTIWEITSRFVNDDCWLMNLCWYGDSCQLIIIKSCFVVRFKNWHYSRLNKWKYVLSDPKQNQYSFSDRYSNTVSLHWLNIFFFKYSGSVYLNMIEFLFTSGSR